MLRFLAAHPSVEKNAVVLSGESYGGTRATWMLELLLHYSLETPEVPAALHDEIQAHWDRIFPDIAGQTAPPERIATQFGAQVLIEPLVAGKQQYDAQSALLATTPDLAPSADRDAYDVRKPVGWSDMLDERASAALRDPKSFAQLVGVAAESIPELQPAARGDAFRVWSASPAIPSAQSVSSALTMQLGSLSRVDGYFAANVCASADYAGDETTAPIFVSLLRHVRTFITHARWDSSIVSAAIPATLARGGLSVTRDDAPREGTPRPGWFRVVLPASDEGAETTVEIRFPPYDDSGHMVATGQPRDLAEDVSAWLSSVNVTREAR